MLTFNAIDVETANADRASIRRIGVVHVLDGEIKDRWRTLVNPKDWFDPFNISIHGIDENDVKNSPTLGFSDWTHNLREENEYNSPYAYSRHF